MLSVMCTASVVLAQPRQHNSDVQNVQFSGVGGEVGVGALRMLG